MLVLYDEDTLLHQTIELLGAKAIPALESPERISVILEALVSSHHRIQKISAVPRVAKIHQDCENAADLDLLGKLLSRSHDVEYLEHLRTAHAAWVAAGHITKDESILPECFRLQSASASRRGQPPNDIFARTGYYAFDMSTGLCKDSWIAIKASANLAVEAAKAVTGPGTKEVDVFGLCRPPGHHCDTKISGGYCYVNNAVIAVEALRHHHRGDDAPMTAILDLDFHHGNGTQDYFYRDPKVMYVSIHGRNEYPYYSGFTAEQGEGLGQGFNLNIPLDPKSSVETYLQAVHTGIDAIAAKKPDYLIVSLGFDTYRMDPLGYFDIDTEDYEKIARLVRRDELGLIPTIILLEGGYVYDKLGDNVLSFLRGWEGHRKQ